VTESETAPTTAEPATYATGTATARGGAITVTTTEFGLPLGIKVGREQLHRDPRELAEDILRLCRQAANRAGLQRRQELAEAGVPGSALDLLKLPKPEDVAGAEIGYEAEYDYEPQSWLEHGDE